MQAVMVALEDTSRGVRMFANLTRQFEVHVLHEEGCTFGLVVHGYQLVCVQG